MRICGEVIRVADGHKEEDILVTVKLSERLNTFVIPRGMRVEVGNVLVIEVSHLS